MSDATTERLERLERTNRRLVAALGVLALLALVALGIGATKDARSLDAGRILLRDPSGTVRAKLGADESGASLIFLDKDGAERLRIQTPDDGPSLMTLTTSDETRPGRAVGLRMTKDGWATLSFLDAAKQERLTFGLGYDGEPRLRMYSKDGKARASLGPDTSGRVDFVLYDEGGNGRALMRLAADGTPQLTLFDAEEKTLFHAP